MGGKNQCMTFFDIALPQDSNWTNKQSLKSSLLQCELLKNDTSVVHFGTIKLAHPTGVCLLDCG